MTRHFTLPRRRARGGGDAAVGIIRDEADRLVAELDRRLKHVEAHVDDLFDLIQDLLARVERLERRSS